MSWSQDGAAAGTLTGVSFSDDGVLTALYSNGEANDLAQVALAKFENAEALVKMGAEHAAYGMDFPAVPERVARLEEAVAVIRALWTGGPVTRPSPFYPLEAAHAHPVPDPAPRIIIGGETPAGARLAARIGDGWSTFDDNFEANLPRYLEALDAAGRDRADQTVLVGFQGDWLGESSFRDTPWFHEPRPTWDRWREIGADGAIVLARSSDDVDALVEAVERW